MYLDFYHLKIKPFQISTDPRFLWLGEKHKEALAVLRYGILENKGFLLLAGEVGTGKTTLIHALINILQDQVIVANVPDPGLETMEFYAYLARAFGLDPGFKTKYEFLTMFSRFLHQAHADNKQVLIIIDEAQRMDQSLLEEIRMLSNIERQSAKLVNIFFVGQIEFNGIILEDRNRALRQRITVSCNIGPISRTETDQYVQHRLKVAGTEKRIFTPGAIKAVHAFSKGYPRLINVICDRALIAGYAEGSPTLSRSVIQECGDEMRLHTQEAQKGTTGDVTREKNQQAMELTTRGGRRSKKPVLYVLLGVLVAAWVGVAATVYSPERMQQLIMIFKGRSTASHPVEDLPKKPVKQPEPVATVVTPKKKPIPIAEPKPVPAEKEKLVFDKDVALHIAFNKHSDLTDEAYQTLDKLAKVMNKDPSMEIVLKGYSRGFGSADYHKKMSEFSANIVKGYLGGKGVVAERVQAMGVVPDAAEDSAANSRDDAQTWVEIRLNGGQ